MEFKGGRFEEEESFSGHSVGATLAYYLRGPKIAGLLPLEGQIRANPKYVWYDRTGDTSRRFRLPENSAMYDVRAGIRLGGVPPELFPTAALEVSLWHAVSYRVAAGRYGFADRPARLAPPAAGPSARGTPATAWRHCPSRRPPFISCW